MKFAVLALALLGGCAAYIPADKVLFSTPDKIKIQWDDFRTTEDAVRAKAQAHCGSRTIEVIDAGQMGTASVSAEKWRTWRCVSAPATL